MPANLNRRARIYILATIILGALVFFVEGVLEWHSQALGRFCFYVILALVCSGLKVKLPSVTGTISANFLFVMLGMVELTQAETIVLACTATFGQGLHKNFHRVHLPQLLFNVASMAIAVAAAYSVYSSGFWRGQLAQPILLVMASATFFLLDTFPVAAVITLTEHRALSTVFRECYLWGFPFYIVGACLAWVIAAGNQQVGWFASIFILPVIYLIYCSFRLYINNMGSEKVHAEEMAALHLRTIEALALAIEAKDHTTHDHLQRVQIYAIEVGRELGLEEAELEALRAAALLHDIGKLAVPEHIISKPGKLTREEFEKMKIHPIVGAEILARVQFPHAVAPIVRAHHEKWNGAGYPDGLRGEEIPIGARILSAVDCLDALASDRQYRLAVSLEEAVKQVVADAGISFDPQVVAIIERRYLEFDQLVKARAIEFQHLSTGVQVDRGREPATGFEVSHPTGSNEKKKMSGDFLASIAAARQEAQNLFELSQDLGNSLSLDETLSVLAVRLKRMIPYDALAVYILRDNKLQPEYVVGENFRLFSSLQIPLGAGLSGWVAENRKAILNGNPNVEPGYLNDPNKFTAMRSALSVPLEGVNGVVGVITLYQNDRDNFTRDHLRILLGITTKISVSIENALRFRLAEQSASTDYLTGLPNARSLFLHLDSEIARCRRLNSSLIVMVCDLNGFKTVNDRFGHMVGDRVLRSLARRLKESCREYDYVARMGGDEFVLVIPGLTDETVQKRVERLDQLASGTAHELELDAILSLSVGVAQFPECGPDAEQILAEADRRMYRDKQEQKMHTEGRRGFNFDQAAGVMK